MSEPAGRDTAKGIQAYQEHTVTTQSRGRLIVLLYDGAIKFLRQALAAIDRGDDGEKGKMIIRAMAIIDELAACLNLEDGGEIARNFQSLYDFMHRHLFEANLHRDKQKVQDVILLLEELNEAWRAIAG